MHNTYSVDVNSVVNAKKHMKCVANSVDISQKAPYSGWLLVCCGSSWKNALFRLAFRDKTRKKPYSGWLFMTKPRKTPYSGWLFKVRPSVVEKRLIQVGFSRQNQEKRLIQVGFSWIWGVSDVGSGV
jgi:hypothetical protein